MFRLPRLRRAVSVGALAALAAAIPAASSRGDLASQYAAGQQQANTLQSAIQADNSTIRGYEGTIGELQARLNVIQRTLSLQEHLLAHVRIELSSARTRLESLEAQYTRDRQQLARQLVADYESPSPDLVDVVVNSNGWDDLLNKVDNLRALARANARTIRLVNAARVAVASQTRQLAVAEARHQRATAAVAVEHDQVAQLRLAVVNRELAVAHDRSQKKGQLNALQKKLTQQETKLQQEAATAQAAASGGAAPAGGCASTPFAPHSGEFGFFPAPGTNYSVGQEPIIAARLDALGKPLQLHLDGISGYRTPQHSVEVGGFADDPHTRGEASDTPGVEGVPESTLNQFCLTRPFPGAAEADHIQEL